MVLNCLKKYVDGDIKGCVAYFADTSQFIADKFYFRGSRDSLETIIGAMRHASVSVSKNFDSWMTLYYPDKDDTWVTLWYTEKMTDKAGKQDSIYYTDDVLVKNGRIRQYDEKQRLFAKCKRFEVAAGLVCCPCRFSLRLTSSLRKSSCVLAGEQVYITRSIRELEE
jgi:hypothetical protein